MLRANILPGMSPLQLKSRTRSPAPEFGCRKQSRLSSNQSASVPEDRGRRRDNQCDILKAWRPVKHSPPTLERDLPHISTKAFRLAARRPQECERREHKGTIRWQQGKPSLELVAACIDNPDES